MMSAASETGCRRLNASAAPPASSSSAPAPRGRRPRLWRVQLPGERAAELQLLVSSQSYRILQVKTGLQAETRGPDRRPARARNPKNRLFEIYIAIFQNHHQNAGMHGEALPADRSTSRAPRVGQRPRPTVDDRRRQRPALCSGYHARAQPAKRPWRALVGVGGALDAAPCPLTSATATRIASALFGSWPALVGDQGGRKQRRHRARPPGRRARWDAIQGAGRGLLLRRPEVPSSFGLRCEQTTENFFRRKQGAAWTALTPPGLFDPGLLLARTGLGVTSDKVTQLPSR